MPPCGSSGLRVEANGGRPLRDRNGRPCGWWDDGSFDARLGCQSNRSVSVQLVIMGEKRLRRLSHTGSPTSEFERSCPIS